MCLLLHALFLHCDFQTPEAVLCGCDKYMLANVYTTNPLLKPIPLGAKDNLSQRFLGRVGELNSLALLSAWGLS